MRDLLKYHKKSFGSMNAVVNHISYILMYDNDIKIMILPLIWLSRPADTSVYIRTKPWPQAIWYRRILCSNCYAQWNNSDPNTSWWNTHIVRYCEKDSSLSFKKYLGGIYQSIGLQTRFSTELLLEQHTVFPWLPCTNESIHIRAISIVYLFNGWWFQ